MEQKTMLGVIGGTGLYEMEGLGAVREVEVDTPFGEPSGPFVLGSLGGAWSWLFCRVTGRGIASCPARSTTVPTSSA